MPLNANKIIGKSFSERRKPGWRGRFYLQDRFDTGNTLQRPDNVFRKQKKRFDLNRNAFWVGDGSRTRDLRNHNPTL